MKFYNRKNELALIEKAIGGKGTRVIVIKGIRRIGKTRLILEALKGKNHIRIFIPKDKTESSFLEDVAEKHSLPAFRKIKDLIIYLFERYECVFLDEFQNFFFIDKSVYSDMQDLIDEYKMEGKNLVLFISGSSYSMLKKIFYDYSKALYGRKDLEIPLFEFKSKTVFQILKDLKISDEDKVKFWSIFGGIPKFYELLYNLNIKSFDEFFDQFIIQNFSALLEEGKAILISELGGEYKSYYTVMEAIAFSKNKLSDIASRFGGDMNSANRYIDLLKNEYNLVASTESLIGKSRFLYINKSNFFDFWFRFIKNNADAYDTNKNNFIKKEILENINAYFGLKFELLCRQAITDGLLDYQNAGKQWGKIRNAPASENTYEIDIAALKDKEVLFGECKWKDEVDAEKVVKELVEKSTYVDHKKDKIVYAVFAKSFKKKIKVYNGRTVYCFDLGDISRSLTN